MSYVVIRISEKNCDIEGFKDTEEACINWAQKLLKKHPDVRLEIYKLVGTAKAAVAVTIEKDGEEPS